MVGAVNRITMPTAMKNYALGPDANKKSLASRVWHTALDYLKTAEGVKNTCKVVDATVSWSKLHNPNIGPGVKAVGGIAKDGKDFLTILEFPVILHNAVKSIRDFFNTDKKKDNLPMAVRDTAVSTLYLTSPVTTAIKMAQTHGILHLSPKILKANSIIGGTGLAIGTFNGACKDINTIHKTSKKIEANGADAAKKTETDILSKQRINTLMSLARNVSYVAVGVFSIITALALTTVAPWLALAASTSALVFTIGAYFHKKVNALPDKINV